MNPSLKIIITIVATILIMLATTMLLELDLINKEITRKLIIYLTLLVELYIGFKLTYFFIIQASKTQ